MALDNQTMLIVSRSGMGDAPPELQQKLISTYFQLLLDGDWQPRVIAFYAEGVRLAVHGSPVLDQLTQLQARGVYLILCSTCLAFYGLRDEVGVGIVGGMTDIMAAMQAAGKVITL